ncbi:hypothetical protein ACP9OK_20195 [Pseudomonas sp. B11]|uniref:hypothetical protein n=1 Tax=Pseudomonas sp. MPFS TaxID=2795724 RepID=UPI001F13C58B|nr:hypothetical protein [Pseudomonas sp. MPFS]
MSSTPVESLSAEQRFRQAFERLKAGHPRVLEHGKPVTQNNVAREAGCDPSALRKARFPALIREIQAYLELHQEPIPSKRQTALKQRRAKRSVADRLKDACLQRDAAQSLLTSAHRRIIELSEQVQSLQHQLDEVLTKPTRISRN